MWPPFVRHILLPVHERLMRRATFRYYQDLMQSQWCTTEELRSRQLEKLHDLVSMALKQTSTYARLAGGVSASWQRCTLSANGALG